MNQNIHEANQKKIRQKKTMGLVLLGAGLFGFVFGLVNDTNGFEFSIPMGLVLAVAGTALFLVNLKKGKAYARYLEQETHRPKSAAEELARQQAEEIEKQELRKGARDMASERKSHMGLGGLGAVIGCLAGGAVWAFILGQGYITVYGGIIMILLSFGGYKLFSLNMGTDGMPVSVILSIVVLPIATYAGFILLLTNHLSIFSSYPGLPFFDKWQQTWGMLREYKLMGDFFKCLGNGYLYMVVAAGGVYALLWRLDR